MKRILLPLLLGASLLAPVPSRAATPYPLAIGTGGVTGIYYQIGAAICRLLRDHPPAAPIDCSSELSIASACRTLDDSLVASAGEIPIAVVPAATRRSDSTASPGSSRAIRSPSLSM